MLASNAPRINRKIAMPVKEVNADMIQRLAPHPKNWRLELQMEIGCGYSHRNRSTYSPGI